jgi:hypothetical protein
MATPANIIFAQSICVFWDFFFSTGVEAVFEYPIFKPLVGRIERQKINETKIRSVICRLYRRPLIGSLMFDMVVGCFQVIKFKPGFPWKM